ncbi:MAG: Ca-activated chloride channel family protein [Candidatus Promineifilaceae bacterium]|jgi:Ca-activated chloride channel family protein
MEFLNPKLLLLIWVTPLIAFWWIWAQRKRESALASFMSAQMQAKLAPKSGNARIRWQIALLVCGLFLSIAALSRPQWGEREETVYQRGRDVIIALDVSRSMLANDVHPNRLARAKIDLIDLITELRGDRAGIMAFRRDAQVICPLTTDYAFLRHALDGCGLHSAAPGETDIGGAITTATQSFDIESGSHRIIVLISDGEDLEGAAIAAAEAAAEKGVVIFTVGLGSDQGSQIPTPDESTKVMQHQGKAVVTRLQNETLDRIANITGGAYVPIATASTASHTLGDIYQQHLVHVSAQDLEETRKLRRVERFQWPLLPALLCFIAAATLSRGRLATMAKRAALVLLMCTTSFAQQSQAQTNDTTSTNAPSIDLKAIPPGRSGARIAQSYFRQGDFAAAATAYERAAATATQDSARAFRFNAAVSLYKSGDFSSALDILSDLARNADSSDIADIEKALGLCAYEAAQATASETPEDLSERADLLREAGEAFRRAARLSESDEQGASNLAITLSELETAAENAHITQLMQKHQDASPAQIAGEMLANQRRIKQGLAAATTNMTSSRIVEFEALAALQKENADIWIPLKGKLLEAAGQDSSPDAQQQMAQLNQQIEATRQNMLDASQQLNHLKSDSNELSDMSEAAIYQLFKAFAPHDMLLQEEIRQQSNCVNWINAPASAPAAGNAFLEAVQGEARSLTDIFKERFDQAVQQMQQQMDAAQTGGPEADPAAQPEGGGLDEDTVRQINELLRLTTASQDEALSNVKRSAMKPASYSAREAHQYLVEIQKLLPKQDNQDQQQDQEQNQDPQQQDEPQEDEPNEDEQPPEQPEDEPEPQPQDAPQNETNETETAESEAEEMLPEDIEKLLERALRREKEHEQERRKHLNRIPLAPTKRDW